jgi:magnesium transporter
VRLFRVDSAGGRWTDVVAEEFAGVIAGAHWFWLDVAEIGADVGVVAQVLEVPPDAVADIFEPSEFPKMKEYDGAVFAISHSPGLSEDRFTTSEVDLLLTDRYLVTFHRESIPGIEWTMQRALAAYEAPAEVMAEILEAAAYRYLTLIDALEQQIEELEGLAIAGDPEVLGRVQALRRDAIVLRALLGPERDTIRAVSRAQLEVGQSVRRRLESTYDDFFRIVESLDAARSLLAAVLDTYRSTVAERTNEVMKVLTVFSAIFLPLALLAGIYGMNFANMPELSWHWGYLGLVAVMVVVAVGLWLYFAWRGFVGGPKLLRVDRVIGRGLGGLVSLTTAPIRGVYGLIVGHEESPEDRSD